ncbi:MAG: hypothetical protein OEY96_12140, partial [Gammaproteobacteria bacterium]|nr:hypothetical protein [Gammaproteobacteria bacterium]
LDLLFASAGLERIGVARSWPYNLYGYIQGFLNLICGGHNELYYRHKRKVSALGSSRLYIIHYLVFPLVILPSILLVLLDAIFINKQGVVTVCYEKTHQH